MSLFWVGWVGFFLNKQHQATEFFSSTKKKQQFILGGHKTLELEGLNTEGKEPHSTDHSVTASTWQQQQTLQ